MKLTAALLSFVTAVALVPALIAQTNQGTSTVAIQNSQHKYSFALIDHNGSMSCWGNWNSNEFKDLKDNPKEDTLYVKKEHGLYVITEAATIAQAKKAMEPISLLGRQQGELGRQQSQLGAEQGKLGAKQGEFGRQMAVIGSDMAAATGNREVALRHRERMKALSKEMEALGRQQGALGEKQKALGSKQSELGKRQSEAAKSADEKITVLIDDAFARGLAKKVR